MANQIKGLTIEIGGDTTELGKALENVNKKSRSLSTELSQINRLLKMDPGNAELLAQKQKALASAVENTAEKLDTLKKAEKQVQKQFERGEVSEEQVRALRREILATSSQLKKYEKSAQEAADAMKDLAEDTDKTTDEIKQLDKEAEGAGKSLSNMAKNSDKMGKAGGGMGSKLAGVAMGGVTLLAGAVTALVGSVIAAAEASRDYRTELGKLETAFDAAGHNADTAMSTYKELQGVIGETDQSVEAAQQIALLADNTEDAAKWAGLAAGVVGRFGDALQPETFYEAANETLKLGEATGAYTQMLEGVGMSVEDFNAGLAECSTEAEKQAYMLQVTEGALGAAAEKYRETNAEVIRANEANEEWMSSVAGVGGAIDPILTDVKLLGASLVAELVPGVQQAADAFRGFLSGDEGAAGALGEALSGMVTQLLDKLVALLPSLLETVLGLVTTLATELVGMLPLLVDTVLQMAISLVETVSSILPLLHKAVISVIPLLITSILAAVPQLLEAAVTLLMTIVQSVPVVVASLVEALPAIAETLISTIMSAIPILLDACINLLMSIVKAIPVILEALSENLPLVIDTLVSGLLGALPLLLDAAIELLFAIIDAIPQIVQACWTNMPKIYMAIISSLLKAVPLILKAAGTLLGQLLIAAGKLLVKLPVTIGEIVVAIVTGLSEAIPDIKTIGSDLIEGLWEGIKDMTGWITDKLAGFGDTILGGIKSFFGIKSPSRVFRKEIGRMLPAGMAQGIDDEADAPVDAVAAMSEDVIGEVGHMDGLTLERRIRNTFDPAPSAAASAEAGLLGKLDKILDAIERGQVLTIDGESLVGATIDRLDNKLGQRRTLAARGAL
jgi:phage-related protein